MEWNMSACLESLLSRQMEAMNGIEEKKCPDLVIEIVILSTKAI
jgi:hypothetical protein